MGYKNTIIDAIRKIRKDTGLSQTDFFNKYLNNKEGVPSLSTDASKQDYMKKLENGINAFPAVLLPVYSEIGNCSIDAIITGRSFEPLRVSKDVNLYDVIKAFFFIDKYFPIHVFSVEKATDCAICFPNLMFPVGGNVTDEQFRCFDRFLKEYKDVCEADEKIGDKIDVVNLWKSTLSNKSDLKTKVIECARHEANYDSAYK